MKQFIFTLSAAAVILAFMPACQQTSGTASINRNMFCAPSFDPAKMKQGEAPLFSGLGNLHFAISTNNKKAQQYFNQGLTLVYSFNHGEAGRSFYAALKHDSTLAMAYWGLGMVLGPNYNAGLNPSGLAEIHDVMNKAVKFSADATPLERALIGALTKRFPQEEVKDMAPYNAAYASAMKEVYDAFPSHAEVTALYADALMNEHPWNLWQKDGTAMPWTAAIRQVLEDGLKKFPDHPGLNHSYIHTMEASKDAAQASVAAQKLETLVPAAGHLVHMPSHIYIRTGEYHQGVLVNEKAVACDSSYVAQCRVEGVYPLMYYPHAIHFLAACAFFEGNSKKAIDAAWMVARKANKAYIQENVTVQHFSIIPAYVMMHMGKWDDILQLEKPDALQKYPVAIWHYVRGMALAAKGLHADAGKELAALKRIAADGTLKAMLIWDMNSALDLVHIAACTLEGELLAYEKKYDAAMALFNKAIAIEDNLTYTEPPDWFFSVRHTAGHWLVKAGRFAEAEKVYREDLELFRENGWALIGLYNSLNGQGKTAEATDAKKRFDTAWQYADIKIETSRKF